VCNTMVYITFDVPVDPEGATVVLLQPPLTQSCQRVLGIGRHLDTISLFYYTGKNGAGQQLLFSVVDRTVTLYIKGEPVASLFIQ
jgi:hypothetical protein